jgi:chaperonin GroES
MSQLKIKPVGDRILVQLIEEKEQVRGGVIIPENAREKSSHARVTALGTGAKGKDGVRSAFAVKVGDTVLLDKFAGSEVRLEGQKYTLVREDDILGVIG